MIVAGAAPHIDIDLGKDEPDMTLQREYCEGDYLAERVGLSETVPGFCPAGAFASLRRPNSLPTNLSYPITLRAIRVLIPPSQQIAKSPAVRGF